MAGRNAVLIASALALVVLVFTQEPIAQDLLYHDFADQRTVLGVANAYNVLSNVLFLFLGAWGALYTLLLLRNSTHKALLTQYLLFFVGVFLSGIGSCYYHCAPSNQTLVWDRLPMSIAFMALLASVVSECIDRKAGAFLFAPFLALGMLGVLSWAWTERMGQGDLRPYIIIQFLPVVLVPLMLILYRPGREYSVPVWSLVALYALAKVFELYDRQVYAFTGLMSGHTIKHIVAASGTGAVLKMLYARRVELTTGRPK